jgi:hypothetical protein
MRAAGIIISLSPGEPSRTLRAVVKDMAGDLLPGVSVDVASAATKFVVGRVGTSVDIPMQIGSLAESVTVTASSPRVAHLSFHYSRR